jgi:hypothetical protein
MNLQWATVALNFGTMHTQSGPIPATPQKLLLCSADTLLYAFIGILDRQQHAEVVLRSKLRDTNVCIILVSMNI